ncbi:hypothetical protein TNCT_356781 [Trichonephila clavata]|uniref:Uncharacterized protein n=1 Tax=Trichonephila clavata TaxID=2740835 RepID=A0A8X6KDD8_TRICU|nr:hypothetical protein TNCT_356781 [Trichonephila clavata]
MWFSLTQIDERSTSADIKCFLESQRFLDTNVIISIALSQNRDESDQRAVSLDESHATQLVSRFCSLFRSRYDHVRIWTDSCGSIDEGFTSNQER